MRLGDDIDDHCSRCKRTTDHSVVSMIGDDVLKTRSAPATATQISTNKGRKKEIPLKEAFDHVLASVTGAQPRHPRLARRK